MGPVQILKRALARLAKFNKDSWSVTVSLHDDESYLITVTEDADHHILLVAAGSTLKEAIADLENDLPAVIKHWGYRMPKNFSLRKP